MLNICVLISHNIIHSDLAIIHYSIMLNRNICVY